MFNLSMKCKNIAKINELPEKHYPHMSARDKGYLLSVPDEQQYPAARCAMDHYVFFFNCKSMMYWTNMRA
jgi:hypothetical protein